MTESSLRRSTPLQLPAGCNIAHRGARSLAPENTLLAYDKARELGAHGIEVDVRMTRDHKLVLFHDALLTRTTDILQTYPHRADEPLSNFTLEELQRLDAGSWFVATDPFGQIAAGAVSLQEIEAMATATIPLLSELLAFVRDHTWFVNLEIKQPIPELTDFPLIESLLNELTHAEIAPQLLSISSFNHDYLRQVHALRPDIEINALIGSRTTGLQDWGNFEFPIYTAHVALTDDEQIARALAHGCQVNIYTVNEQQTMRHLLDHGVSRIITDFPQRLHALTHHSFSAEK